MHQQESSMRMAIGLACSISVHTVLYSLCYDSTDPVSLHKTKASSHARIIPLQIELRQQNFVTHVI